MDLFAPIEPRHPGREGDYLDLGPPPERVYARLDRFDADALGGGRAAYDCVDADWFDAAAREVGWLGEAAVGEELGERISIVEEELQDDGVTELEGRWFELRFDTGEREVEHYLNLFAEPLLRTMSISTAIPSRAEAELVAKTGFGEEVRDADRGEIGAALGELPAPRAAAVYDVGQGSANALLSDGVPTLYFDVGGGTTANARTYPATMRRFCVSADPPVVLSHWDWDHWSSALRDRRLLDRRWIVPRHDGQLGAVHTRLLGELHQRGRLLVWPRGLPSAAGDGILVEQCAGSPSDRNNSGLALVIAGRTSDEGARMLFPGDAAYGHVPSAGGELTSLAVPHHGGRTPSSQVPRPDGARPGRAVFSYGAGNCYWHPLADVGREHQRDWKRRLHTAARDRRGLGHVHLYWNEADPDAEPPCGGAACDLGCHLR